MKNVVIQTDPIADMLSRIRNAAAVGSNSVDVPHSKLKENIAKILAKYGFLSDVKSRVDGNIKILTITINSPGTSSRITKISRISRPGRRAYVSAEKIPVVKRGRGIVIISTSLGILASPEAKAKGVGGELICEVY